MIPTYALVLLHASPAIWCVYHALLYKRDPRSAAGWIIVSLFVPFGGPIAYYLFGINRVRTRARTLKRNLFSIDYEIGEQVEPPADNFSGTILDVGLRITGHSASANNKVEALYNGDSAYPKMIEAIQAAQKHVFLATYILQTDTIGMQFVQALEAAQQRGVEVYVLVDGIGEFYSLRKISTVLRSKNINVARFLPPKLIPPSVSINLRNHRKLLIVDDAVAFAGGMNISDDHATDENGIRQVTDVHFRFQGPVIADLHKIFCRDWRYTTGKQLDSPSPTVWRESTSVFCRAIPDGPDGKLDALALTIQAVVGAAKSTVDIVTPYFLPNRDLIALLQSAAHRGVRVRVVLPAKNNLIYVHWANRNLLAELVTWGVQIYYQPAPFCHAKLLTIDTEYTLVGSANLDPRSLRLNFELGVEVLSREFNSEIKTHIDNTIELSKPVTMDELVNRSVPTRLRDSAAALLSPYL